MYYQMASLLKKFVDAEQWNAEDIAGQLGMVFHAAFLFAGFQPYGAQPRSGHLLKKQSREKEGSSLCLSRQYTAPDLAHHDGADAAVLMLCAQRSDVALLVFLTTTGDDDAPEKAYLGRLDLETVRPLLSRSLGGAEPRASRICKSLADGLCWGFLHELCRRNGLPLTGFTSLPDDLKGAVLEKLTDGKDLARVECVSSQLRLLVAERDHELWKALYKALPARQRRGRWRLWLFFPDAENSYEEEETLSPGSSWKNKYLGSRWRFYPMPLPRSWPFDFFDPIRMIRRRDRGLSSRPLEYWLFRFRHLRETLSLGSSWKDKYCVEASRRSRPMFSWYLDSFDPIPMLRRRNLFSWPLDYWLIQHPPEEETVPPSFDRSGRRHRQKLARNDCKKKWHGGGAIHSLADHALLICLQLKSGIYSQLND